MWMGIQNQIGIIASSIQKSNTEKVYKITVSSSKLTETLINFPIRVDISKLGNSFWNNVRSDGGNIRAYASDKTTLIPIDVTYINKTRKIGRLYFKQSLINGVNNIAYIRVLDTSIVTLSNTDPNGRNAVWDDYEVVMIFPETVNRTGKTYTQTVSSFLSHSEWARIDYNNLEGSPHNGIATDGNWLIACDDIVLRRMNPEKPYGVVQTVSNINTALSVMTGLSNFDHMGDPVCVGTSTFFTVTTSDATYRRFLVEYRTSDLTLLNAWEMTGAQRIFGATVCYDGTNLLIFSFEDDTKFIKYTTAGSYVSDVSITGRPGGMNDYQGSTVLPTGNILISGGTDGIFEITPSGAYVQKAYTDPHADIMEGLEYRDGKLWLLKGDGALITLRNDVCFDFRYLHQNDRAYTTLPVSTIWTMGVTSRQVRTDYQYNYITLDDIGNTANTGRSGIAYDEGTGLDLMGVWNSTDLWLYATPALTPVAYDVMRMTHGHNNNLERKLRIRKDDVIYSNVDVGVSPRPSGTTMDFILNSSQRGTSEPGAGYYQFAWLRNQYMSDAWIDADGLNESETVNFCDIAEENW